MEHSWQHHSCFQAWAQGFSGAAKQEPMSNSKFRLVTQTTLKLFYTVSESRAFPPSPLRDLRLENPTKNPTHQINRDRPDQLKTTPMLEIQDSINQNCTAKQYETRS
jgi:hypothetical protein